MKRTDYEAFKKTVSIADESHDVWWCGYLFMELTPKQSDEIMNILFKRGIFKVIEGRTPDGQGFRTGLLLPSGITIYERESY